MATSSNIGADSYNHMNNDNSVQWTDDQRDELARRSLEPRDPQYGGGLERRITAGSATNAGLRTQIYRVEKDQVRHPKHRVEIVLEDTPEAVYVYRVTEAGVDEGFVWLDFGGKDERGSYSINIPIRRIREVKVINV